MNMAKMMLKIIVNKVIIKVHKYNSNDGIEYESEDDGIEYYIYIYWCDSGASEYNPRSC